MRNEKKKREMLDDQKALMEKRIWDSERQCEVFVSFKELRSFIYGIIINVDVAYEGQQWKLLKVGLTRVKANRMKTLMAEITRNLPGVPRSIIFQQCIDPFDTRNDLEIEADIRKRCGIPISKMLLNKLQEELKYSFALPFKTEWVLTSQSFIDSLKQKTSRKETNSSKLFKDLKFSTDKKIDVEELLKCFGLKFSKLAVKFGKFKDSLNDKLDAAGIVELFSQKDQLLKFIHEGNAESCSSPLEVIEKYRGKRTWFMKDYEEKLCKLPLQLFEDVLEASVSLTQSENIETYLASVMQDYEIPDSSDEGFVDTE